VRALRELTEQQTAALRLAEERYQRGLTDFLTVADSQRAALDAESRWLEARRAMLDVRIDLHLALGGAFTVPTEDDPEPTPSDELADAR
jgi:multidrug efflux system outer membrane protein